MVAEYPVAGQRSNYIASPELARKNIRFPAALNIASPKDQRALETAA